MHEREREAKSKRSKGERADDEVDDRLVAAALERFDERDEAERGNARHLDPPGGTAPHAASRPGDRVVVTTSVRPASSTPRASSDVARRPPYLTMSQRSSQLSICARSSAGATFPRERNSSAVVRSRVATW